MTVYREETDIRGKYAGEDIVAAVKRRSLEIIASVTMKPPMTELFAELLALPRVTMVEIINQFGTGIRMTNRPVVHSPSEV